MSDGGDLEHADRIIRGITKKYVGAGELTRIIAAAEKRGKLAGLKEAAAIMDVSGGFIDCVAEDAIKRRIAEIEGARK